MEAFDAFTVKPINAVDDKRKYQPTTFDVQDKIKQYQKDVAANLGTRPAENDMTDDEQKAQIARNTASAELAQKNHDKTKERGSTVLAVKQKIIWN